MRPHHIASRGISAMTFRLREILFVSAGLILEIGIVWTLSLAYQAGNHFPKSSKALGGWG